MTIQQRIAAVILAGSLLAIAFLTLAPTLAGEQESRWCLVCGRQVLGDLLLNVLLFVPLGLSLRLLRVARWRAFGIAILATASIELAQGLLLRGRFASASDIVTNSMGAMMGYALGVHWRVLLFPPARLAVRLGGGTLLAWLAIFAGAAWALTPRLDAGEYRIVTQQDPSSGVTPVVDASLVRAISNSGAVDASPRLDTRAPLRELLLFVRFRPSASDTTDTVIASVHRTGASPAITVRRERRLLLLVVHTPARALYLHEPTIYAGLIDSLPMTPDSLVSLAGGIQGNAVVLYQIRDSLAVDPQRLALAPSLWMYLLVGASLAPRIIVLLSILLHAALLGPAAYWLSHAAASSAGPQRPARILAALAASSLTVILGLAGMPWISGLAPAPRVVWITALTCIGAATLASWFARSRAHDG